jgi:hypothetical protein
VVRRCCGAYVAGSAAPGPYRRNIFEWRQSRIEEEIEEIELQIAERQKFDIRRLAASKDGLD